MHAKTDSEGTSIDAALSPPRSAIRPLYYVQSPSNHDVEKMSFGSGCSPMGSPSHPHYYHCSPIHHSRESSTSRFSDRALLSYKSIREGSGRGRYVNSRDDETDIEDDDDDPLRTVRLYACLFLSVFLLFTLFSLILWATSKSYPPQVLVKGMLVKNLNVQAGTDLNGVPTDLMSFNSTVKIFYRNPSTFFAVHVTASPLRLHYSRLLLSSGEMEKFTVPRKSVRTVKTVVHGHQVPLYGGVHLDTLLVPLNLTVHLRSRAYIMGRLVTSKFYTRILCSFTLNAKRLPRNISLLYKCAHIH